MGLILDKGKYIALTATAATVLLTTPVESNQLIPLHNYPTQELNQTLAWESVLDNPFYSFNPVQLPEDLSIACNFVQSLYDNSVDLDPTIRKIIDKEFWKLI